MFIPLFTFAYVQSKTVHPSSTRSLYSLYLIIILPSVIILFMNYSPIFIIGLFFVLLIFSIPAEERLLLLLEANQ